MEHHLKVVVAERLGLNRRRRGVQYPLYAVSLVIRSCSDRIGAQVGLSHAARQIQLAMVPQWRPKAVNSKLAYDATIRYSFRPQRLAMYIILTILVGLETGG